MIHDYLSEYNLKDLSPNSMAGLAQRLYEDEDLAQRYENNRYKRGTGAPKAVLNDQKYKCLLKTESFESKECMGKNPKSLKNPDNFFEILAGPWIATE